MDHSTAIPLPIVLPRSRSRLRQALPALLLLAPSLVFLIAFTYWPVLQVLWQSFVVQSFGGTAHWGAGNYQRLFADPLFIGAVWNNVIYAIGTIVPSLALSLGFALALARQTWLNTALRTLVVMPMLIPLVAAASLFVFICIPGDGLLDYYLAKLGIGSTNWLGTPSLALGSVIVITVWKNTGYYMLFFLTGLAGIPADLYEAARLENASPWQRFRRITLPLLGPTIAFVLVIAMMNALTQIDHVVVMTKGGPSNATSMLLYYIYQQAEQNYDTGLAAAATVISVGFLFALSVVSLRALERGIHYES